MFVKLAVFTCLVAVCVADGKWYGPLAGGQPADLYPAGVSPHACPNFPNCDNPALAANPGAPAHGGWNGGHGGAWNGAGGGGWNGAGAGGGWNGGHGNNGGWNGHQSALDNGEYTGDGDYRGEGLAESGAYGDAHNGGGYAGAPAAYGHGQAAQVPAGVDAHSCPNYPFCH